MFGPAPPRFGRPAWLGLGTLGVSLALAYGTALPRAIPDATPPIVLASLGIAAVNAVGEEVLWRGMYQRIFSGRTWLGVAWPSLMVDGRDTDVRAALKERQMQSLATHPIDRNTVVARGATWAKETLR